MVVADDRDGDGRLAPGVVERLIRDDRVSGKLYTDPRVFEREMACIHHRGWLFVGHESEVALPGEFVTRRLGLQPVVVTRDEGSGSRRRGRSRARRASSPPVGGPGGG